VLDQPDFIHETGDDLCAPGKSESNITDPIGVEIPSLSKESGLRILKVRELTGDHRPNGRFV
jgi:hypothetical protein